MHREFNAETINADAVILSSDNETADSIKFGVDQNGKLGYIAPGADTVTPFRGFGDLEAAYNDGIADAKAEWIASVIISGSGSNGSYIYSTTETFDKNYAQVIAFMSHDDSDNNNDNFMKIYSSDKGFTTAANPAASYWTNTVDEWNYYKPTLSGLTSGGGMSATNTGKYASVPNDFGKDVYRYLFSRYVHSCVAYKNDVKAGDTAYVYASHGTLVHFVGIPATGLETYDGATEAETDIYKRGYAAGFEYGGPHTGYDVAGGTYTVKAAGTKTLTVPYPGCYILTIADSAATSTTYTACTATGTSNLTLTNMGAWNSNATETSASPTFASFTYYLVKSSGSDETITMSYPEVTGSRVSRYRLIRIGTSGDGTSSYEQGYAAGIAGATNLVKLFSTSHVWDDADRDYTYTFNDNYAYALVFVATGSTADDNDVSISKTSGDGIIEALYSQPYWNSSGKIAIQTNVYKITGITAGSVFRIINKMHGGFAIFVPQDYREYDINGD